MTASSSLTIVTNAVSTLTGYFEAVMPILIPVVIAVMILFAGLGWLRSLWNKRA